MPANACPAKCQGKATQEMVFALQRRGAAARHCYIRALADAAPKTPEGRMSIRLLITEGGSVCSSRIVQSDMSDTMNDCVLQTFAKAEYPPPEGGCLQVNIPLSFRSPPPSNTAP